MTDHDALLATIIAQPDEDTPRLAYADWLDEHDNPARAEFIRLQHRLEPLPPGPERSALEDRADELLALHEMDWLGPVDKLYSWGWRRGFVEEASGGPRPTLEAARGQFERNPVRVVGFGTVCWDLHEMIELPFLERIEELTFDVGDQPENRPILLNFLASPRLARLHAVDIAMGRSGGVLADLANQVALPPLERIRLRELTRQDADALLDVPTLRELTDVGGWDGMEATALARLFEAPDRWTGLDLGFGELPAASLAGLAVCGRLRRLVFRWPEGHREPLRLPASVEDLEVRAVWNQGPPPGALARTLDGTRLCRLEFDWGPEDEIPTPEDWDGLGELLEGLPGPVLDLTLSGFTEDPLPRFARLPGLQNIRRLDLSRFPGSDAGVDALAGCLSLTGLREFESSIEWTPEQSRRLADTPFLSKLRKLRFQGPLLGDEGAAAFLRSPWLRRLRTLEWLSAGVGPATIEALAAWPGLAGLRRLCLYFNPLRGAVMQPLVERLGVRFSQSLPLREG